MEAWLQQLLAALALPEYGLSTVFVVSFVSATLLPLGSEPAVFGLIQLNPHLFWPAILVATAPLGAHGSYLTVVIVALAVTAAAFAASLLVPKPVDAEVAP